MKRTVPFVGLFMPALLPLLAVMVVGCPPTQPEPLECAGEWWEIPAKFGGGCLECPEGYERFNSHGVYGICTVVESTLCYEWEYEDFNGKTKPRAIYCNPTEKEDQ